ncbi:MAG: DUF4173 domain-containing protein [Clostridia bacterium]|nr:DUF4173 domain-containing protein [Clostridia bacterium]
MENTHDENTVVSPLLQAPNTLLPPRKQYCSDRRDILLAGVLAILSVVGVYLSLFGGFRLGFVLSYVAILACGGIYLSSRTERPTPYALFCISAAVASTGIFLWHNDGVMKFFSFCGILLLTMLALAEVTAPQRDGAKLLTESLRLLVAFPLQHVGDALPAIFRIQRGETIEKRRCGGVLLGLLCSLPALLVVVPLLISADAAFEGLLENVAPQNGGEAIGSLILGLCLFGLLFSRWFGLRYSMASTAPLQAKARKGADAAAINAFLGVISGVYLLYLFSQLAYFFSAFSGILPKNYTVAQYARRGFFEMCAVCAVNVGLVALSLWLCRKNKEGKTPLSIRIQTLFILIFSLGLVAVALSKMGLYIGSFGMTRLRILTSVFMVMLGAALIGIILRLFLPRLPYVKVIIATVAVLGLVAGYVDVDTTVARYNVTAYQNGKLEQIDVGTLSRLSDGATPYLVKLLKDKDYNVRSQAAHALYSRIEEWGDFDDNGKFKADERIPLREYTVDAARSRALLLKNAKRIYKLL